eukprot:scaffold75760_cov60-Cyclotella_meneghiniana.AAC.1
MICAFDRIRIIDGLLHQILDPNFCTLPLPNVKIGVEHKRNLHFPSSRKVMLGVFSDRGRFGHDQSFTNIQFTCKLPHVVATYRVNP